MLVDKIKQDQLSARKRRDSLSTKLLTTLYSDVMMVGKNDGGRETTNIEVVSILKKYIKSAEEVMSNLSPSDERFAYAAFEIEALNSYLPNQLSKIELTAVIAQIIDAREFSSMKDMGKVMQALKATYDGTYDGATAVDIVRQQLGK